MHSRDKLRLLKIDEELLNVEQELQIALELEAKEGASVYFKPSKGIALKLKGLQTKRTNLMRNASQRIDRLRTYEEILTLRKRDADKAADAVDKAQADLYYQEAIYLAFPSREKLEEIKLRIRELQNLKLVAFNKEKAVENWLSKSDLFKIAIRPRKNKHDKFKEALAAKIVDEDIKKVNTFESKKESFESLYPAPVSLEVQIEPTRTREIEIKTPESILGNDPNWESKDVNNTASFDLFKSSPLVASSEVEVQAEPKVCPTVEQVSKPKIVVDI